MGLTERGIKRQRRAGGQTAYVAITHAGDIAFEIVLDPKRYPVERHPEILRYLQRHLLDPVDPPLSLAVGGPERSPRGIALSPAAFEDPYGLESPPK